MEVAYTGALIAGLIGFFRPAFRLLFRPILSGDFRFRIAFQIPQPISSCSEIASALDWSNNGSGVSCQKVWITGRGYGT